MRAKFSWSFLHYGKVVSLAVLYAAFFAGSSNVLAQEGSATISPAAVLPIDSIPLADNEGITQIHKVSRVKPSVTRVLETLGSTLRTNLEQTDWSFVSTPNSGRASFLLADGGFAATTRGSRSTVTYRFFSPPGVIGFGANDAFVVQSSGTNTTGGEQVASTWTFVVNIAADLQPPPTFDIDSLTVDSHRRVPSTDFVVRLTTKYPGTVTLLFDAPLAGEAAFVKSDRSTATTLSVSTTAASTPVTIRFTRPVPDGGFMGTAFEVVATDDDTRLSDRVNVTVENVANSAPVITGPSAESLSIHESQKINTFTFNAGDLDRGERPEDLSWNLVDGIGDRSTAVFVNGTAESIGTETVQVRFSQAVDTFTAGVSTRTFTLTLSDGLATARSVVAVVIAENQPPVIESVDGQDTREQEAVTFTISPNSTVVTFPVAAADDFEPENLTWEISSVEASTVRFVVGNELRTTAVGTTVVASLERSTSATTGSFDLLARDSSGTTDRVNVTVEPGESTPTFMLTDSQPISEGNSVARRFSATHGLGQGASLTWTVTSTDNVVVTPSSADGETAVFTATLQDAVSRLDGRYVLTVTNADDNSTSSTVMVSVANVPPVITVQNVTDGILLLPVGQTTARIDYEATDETGVVTLTWTIVDVSAGSTVGFVVGESTTETTTGSTATVSFEGPSPSSEVDIVRSVTVQVTDGFGGLSTALATVRYLPEEGPFIFYQGSSLSETLTLTLEPGDATTISLMARGGGGGAELTWSLSSITTSFTSVAFDNNSTQISMAKSVVIETQLGAQQQTGSFDVEVRHGGSDVSDSVTVTVTREPSVSRFRIRALLGGAVR